MIILPIHMKKEMFNIYGFSSLSKINQNMSLCGILWSIKLLYVILPDVNILKTFFFPGRTVELLNDGNVGRQTKFL